MTGTASASFDASGSATRDLWKRSWIWRWSLILGAVSAGGYAWLVPSPDAPMATASYPSADSATGSYASPMSPAVRAMMNERVAEAAAAREAAARAQAELAEERRKAEEASLAARVALAQAQLQARAQADAQARAEAQAQAQARAQAEAQARAQAEAAARSQAALQNARPVPPPAPPTAVAPSAGLVAPNPALNSGVVTVVSPQTADITTPTDPKAAGSVRVAGRVFPLPSGRFILVASNQSQMGATNAQNVALAQIRDGKLVAGVVIVATPRDVKTGAGARAFASCNRNDFHYLNTIANEEFGRQECHYATHIWPQAWSAPDAGSLYRSFAVDLQTRQVAVPNALVMVGYHFANTETLVRVFYYFNPEMRGIQSAKTASWNESDWHKTYLARDARRIDYMGEIEKWTRDWLPFVRPAFLGEQPTQAPSRLATLFVP